MYIFPQNDCVKKDSDETKYMLFLIKDDELLNLEF